MKVLQCLFLACLLQVPCQLSGADAAVRDYWPTEEWRGILPEKAGFDSKALTTLNTRLLAQLPKTSSILIVRNGYVIHEKYFQGEADTLRETWSETKSVVSILIGVLVKRGLLSGIDQNVLEILPELRSSQTTRESDQLTLRHLLTMTSGFPDDEGEGLLSQDHIMELLTEKQKAKPGELFTYNGTNANLLSMIISRLADESAESLAYETLFERLGITRYFWKKKFDVSNGAFGLSLTTRDIAKIGYLYLNRGTWANEELVGKEWVESSTKAQVATKAKGKYLESYGYMWWVTTINNHPTFQAVGYGGQVTTVIPSLDLIVVVTTNEENNDRIEKYVGVAADYVLPAMNK